MHHWIPVETRWNRRGCASHRTISLWHASHQADLKRHGHPGMSHFSLSFLELALTKALWGPGRRDVCLYKPAFPRGTFRRISRSASSSYVHILPQNRVEGPWLFPLFLLFILFYFVIDHPPTRTSATTQCLQSPDPP